MACIKTILKERIDYYTSMRGLTQKEVAERAGIGFRTYWKIMRGDHWIDWKTLIGLCKALNCEPVDLFTITVSLTPTQAAEIHAEIGNVINKHLAYGWQQAARDEIMFELFDNEPEDEGKANGVRRN